VDGKYPYNVATVPLFSELTKLIISAYFLYLAKQKDPKGTQVNPSPLFRAAFCWFQASKRKAPPPGLVSGVSYPEVSYP
jgi:hypothetical protein